MVLVAFKRWRHLFVFVGTVLMVTWLIAQLQLVTARPRPLGVTIIGSWQGFSFPSATVATAAITGLGVIYTLLEPGRARRTGAI